MKSILHVTAIEAALLSDLLDACARACDGRISHQNIVGLVCYTQAVMATNTVPTITALQAQAEANLFLSDHLPDRFMASRPSLDAAANVWCVPVLLAYPIIGPVGQTGEILVSATSAEVLSHTPLDEMKAAARALYEQHRETIEAPVP